MRISVITPTHRIEFLKEAYESLKAQTFQDWQWVLVPDSNVLEACKELVKDDPRVKLVHFDEPFQGIGHKKNYSFHQGDGEILVELDSDDLLTPDCLEKLDKAFVPGVDFVYSDFADFKPDGSPSTFGEVGAQNGWEYYDFSCDSKPYKSARAWEPSAAALSLIFYAPNHVRAWKRDFYRSIGGHNKDYKLADDHELLIRTYLKGKMVHVPECLYLYRMGEQNTFSKNADEISRLTHGLYNQYIQELVLRENELSGHQCVDLGGAFNSPAGWVSCDQQDAKIIADLSGTWPFADNSVGAFRAFDFLEHLKDKMHTLSEIHRCLKPGGYLLSLTPDALGNGAHCDPTHVAYFVPRSFKYYTDKDVAKFIRNSTIRFQEMRLVNGYPSDWAKSEDIPYVTFDALALKDGMKRLPGIIRI